MTAAALPDSLEAPRYGTTLADLMPSALACLDVPGAVDVLGLGERLDARRVVVVLVDGMGDLLLREHADTAPFLASIAAPAIDSCFPSTTATSLGSLGTGGPPGQHGLFGYQVMDADRGVVVNELRWDPELDPHVWQDRATVFERAMSAGVDVTRVGRSEFDGSGLTEAAIRGGRYVGADDLPSMVDRVIDAVRAISDDSRALVYGYHGTLDLLGHLAGPGTDAWVSELRDVDAALERLAAALPPATALVVTADHGMLVGGERIDVDAVPGLRTDVVALSGEARARYVHTTPGATTDVAARWRETLGSSAVVATRDDAVRAGWFGPVRAELEARLGDLVVVPTEDAVIVATEAEPLESSLIGYHGGLTRAEVAVPLRVVQA